MCIIKPTIMRCRIYIKLDIFTMLFLGMCPSITLCYLMALLCELRTLMVIATWPGLPVLAFNFNYVLISDIFN